MSKVEATRHCKKALDCNSKDPTPAALATSQAGEIATRALDIAGAVLRAIWPALVGPTASESARRVEAASAPFNVARHAGLPSGNANRWPAATPAEIVGRNRRGAATTPRKGAPGVDRKDGAGAGKARRRPAPPARSDVTLVLQIDVGAIRSLLAGRRGAD